MWRQHRSSRLSRASTACILLFLLVLLVPSCSSFSLEEMCATRCSYGLGGNLCHCNQNHFAGKRAGSLASSHSSGSLLALRTFQDRKVREDGGSQGALGSEAGPEVVLEGFFGLQGREEQGQRPPHRSAVSRLASLLKTALDE